jgi:hypothetical protein
MTDAGPEQGGPSYYEPVHGSLLSSSKVSVAGRPWDTVLIVCLRFKRDGTTTLADPARHIPLGTMEVPINL